MEGRLYLFDENFVSFNGQWGSIWKSQETGVITVDPKAGEWTGKIIEEEGISRVIKSEAALKATERKVIKDKEKRLCGGAAFLEYSHYDKYNVNMVVCNYSSGVEFRITTNQTCPRCRDY